MAKICRDCNNGTCFDVRYSVKFYTQRSVTEGTENCTNRKSFWVYDTTGIIGAITREQIIDRNTGNLTEDFFTVLDVSGIKVPILSGNFTELFRDSAFKTDPDQLLIAQCQFRDIQIISIDLVEPSLIATNGIICNCSGGDERINCSGAEGGICCISKASLDSLCSILG